MIITYFVFFRIAPFTKREYFSENDKYASLKFGKNESLKIMQLTDLHLIYPFGKRYEELFASIEKAVSKEKPKLIVVTGDLALSPLNFVIYDKFEALMEKLNQKWAVCFGNHDCHIGFSKKLLIKRILKYKNCLNMPSPKGNDSYTDFIIKIRSSEPENSFALCLMDSGSYKILNGKVEHSFINDKQIVWFENSMDSLMNPDNLIFCHYPVPELAQLVLTKDFNGNMGTAPSIHGENTKIFNTALGNNTLGIFFGHDHRNDFCGTAGGMILAYGRYSGIKFFNSGNLKPGARIIKLDNNGSKIITNIIEF